MSCSLGKNFGLVLLIAFILMTSIGGVLSSQAMMNDGMMHPCPFMGMTAICDMSPLAHLAQWQQMFWATAQTITTIALLLLLALAISWHLREDLSLPKHAERFIPRYRYRERVFEPLRLAFARGLIHSKAY